MKALLVIDIDHGDDWKPDIVQANQKMALVAEEVKTVLGKERANGGIVVFVVLAFGSKTCGELVTGHEAQLECHEDERKKQEDKELFVKKALNQLGILGINPAQTAKDSQNPKCIICDGLPERSRLASFLEHKHETPFEAAFIKKESNAFTNRGLAPYLHSKGVKEVVLVGCNTFQCVLYTAIGALKAGFNVTLLEECSYPPFNNDEGRYSTKKYWLERAMEGSEQSKFIAKIV